MQDSLIGSIRSWPVVLLLLALVTLLTGMGAYLDVMPFLLIGTVGLALSLAAISRRYLLLFLIVLTIPIRNISVLNVSSANIRIGDIILVAAAGTILLEILSHQRKLPLSNLGLILTLFVVFCFFSLGWSLDPAFGVVRATKYLRDLVLFGVFAYYLRQDFARSHVTIVWSVIGSCGYLFAGMLLALATGQADLQALVSAETTTSQALVGWRNEGVGGLTFAGTINSLAMWINFSIFVWLSTGYWSPGHRQKRLLFLAGLGILLTMELSTLSRGGWLGLVVGGGWWMWHVRSHLRVSKATSTMVALALLIAIAVLMRTDFAELIISRVLSSSQVRNDLAVSLRFEYWRSGADTLLTRPILGIGMGGTARTTGVVFGEWFLHSVFLQLLVELGLVGFLVWVLAMGVGFANLRHAMRRNDSWHTKVIAISMGGALFSFLAFGLTGGDFTEMEWWIVLAVLSSMAPIIRSGGTFGLHLAPQTTRHDPGKPDRINAVSVRKASPDNESGIHD